MPLHPLFSAVRTPVTAALIAAFGTPVLAQSVPGPRAPQTLGEVTIKSGAADDAYAPAASTTATKGSAPLRDVPQAVNVVPGQLLRDQGARSMEDALRNVPGVAMSHGDGQRDQVVIRGFTAIADQFVDGVRDDALYFRDLADIERIEVLKGPAAVLYGRGSSGGLINRVTKKPVFGTTFGEATVGLGSHAFRRATADVNLGINDAAALRLNLAGEDSGSYRDQQFVKRHNFAPSLALKLAPETQLLLQYTNARDQRLTDFGIPALNGRPVNVPAGTYYGSGTAVKDDTSTSNVQSLTATLNHRFNDDWSVRNVTRVYDYTLDRYNTLPSGTTDPVTMTVGRTRSLVFRDESGVFNQTDVTWRNHLGGLRQEWLMGMELGQQKKRAESVSGGVVDRVSILNPGNVPTPAIPVSAYTATGAIPSHTEQGTVGLYLQDQITLAPQWKALVGARYDVFKQDTRFDRTLASLERTDKKFSPRAGLVWQPSEQVSYYVSYSKSFQPSGETFALAANNTANEPEITQNKEIGVKLDLLDGRLNLTGALFHLERTNIKNTDPSNPARQINVGTQRTNGLELTGSGRLSGWDVSAGYAYLNGRMTKSLASAASSQLPVVNVPSQGKVAALTPRNSAFLWAMKDVGHGLRLGGGVSHVGERYTSLTNLVTLPAYTTVDAALQYTLGQWGLDVNVKNLTNRKYYVSAHGSNDNLILPGSPRALQVTLRTRF